MLGSLRGRLALSNLAITLIALLVLTFVFAQILRQHSIVVQQNEVRQEAVALQADVNHEIQLSAKIGVGNFFEYLSHDSRLLNKRIILFNSTGCAFDSAHLRRARDFTPPIQGCAARSYAPWLILPVRSHKTATHYVKRGSQTFLLSQRPTDHGNGAVVLVTNASSVTPTWITIAPAFLYAALAAAIIWLLMALYFAYAVSRPLLKIADVAQAMAHGDYSRRVQVRSSGEIDQLAKSFNEMVTQVGASHQLLRDFVANVSHDLRTPLTLISGYAGTLLDGTARNKHEEREAAIVICDEAGRMQRLVDDLLQLTRLESGLRKFDARPLSISDLVARTIRRISAASPGRTISNNVPDDFPLAMADEELVERVLMNLLNNAVEHTGADSEVMVSASLASDWIEVAVSDSGPGIPQTDLSRVFERFYRADRSRSRDNGHSGLGLPIVKEIVEAHGGRVSLDSEVGKGSTVRFTVPRFRASHPMSPAMPSGSGAV